MNALWPPFQWQALDHDLRVMQFNQSAPCPPVFHPPTQRAHSEYARYYIETGRWEHAYGSLMRAREYCHGDLMRENALQAAVVCLQMPNSSAADLKDVLDAVLSSRGGATTQERAASETLVGYAFLREGRFEKAAEHLLRLRPEMGDLTANALIADDAAIGAVLCALATMSRHQIQSRVIKNDEFRDVCRDIPSLLSMAEAFFQCRFKDCLQTLDGLKVSYCSSVFVFWPIACLVLTECALALLSVCNLSLSQNRICLDPVMAMQYKALTHRILQRAIVTYFEPYSTVDLGKMSALFGVEEAVLEDACVELIANNKLPARIDAHTKTLKATVADQRASTFKEAQVAADDTIRSIRAAVMRASCSLHAFEVGPPAKIAMGGPDRAQAHDAGGIMSGGSLLQGMFGMGMNMGMGLNMGMGTGMGMGMGMDAMDDYMGDGDMEY